MTARPEPKKLPSSIPISRECTRCDGEQHLIGGQDGMGLYRCDVCQMRVGFDLEADPKEFLFDRGHPKDYSQKKATFGNRLMPSERQLG